MTDYIRKKSSISYAFRKIHRISSIYLLLFFLVISVTGIIPGLKKHSGGYLLAKTNGDKIFKKMMSRILSKFGFKSYETSSTFY